MEKITFFTKKIAEVFEEYLRDLRQPINQHLTIIPVMDKENHHYQIVVYGWENNRRVFNMLFHLDIIEDKIWVQSDKMEWSIAEMLVEKGVSKKDIVLAYFPERHRKYTEYAA